MSTERQIYRVIFLNNGKTYEIYAGQIYQSELYGFIEVEEFRFGERSGVVVDPAEEKLKNEFSDVIRSYIPLQAIIRIDEVKKEGPAKVSDARGPNVATLAFPPAPPRDR
ncbi:DUF1820 family protein [Alcanivorax sp. S6407]|uniref:DUF1820 family protein n=1 Tax=Alcanivorax sp. S6407 TaxID=2926424 RepID=UPI001FF51AD3|nr:DUF1820 family protein [Alcanivorax sp. S6407]MCK0153207.1 DUF1820 family protein [Alcanivorax sp. S6407]